MHPRRKEKSYANPSAVTSKTCSTWGADKIVLLIYLAKTMPEGIYGRYDIAVSYIILESCKKYIYKNVGAKYY